MLKSLLADPVARVVIAVWTLVAFLLFVPILPSAWMAAFSSQAVDLPFLPLVLLAVAFGYRGIEDDVERRFWRLVGFAYASWLVISVSYLFVNVGHERGIGW